MKKRFLANEDVIETLRKRQDILAKFKVKKIGLFGSFARNQHKPSSDIDLFVEFEVPSLDNFMGLVFSLEDLFGRRVEILTPAGVANIRLKEVADEIRKSIVYV